MELSAWALLVTCCVSCGKRLVQRFLKCNSPGALALITLNPNDPEGRVPQALPVGIY